MSLFVLFEVECSIGCTRLVVYVTVSWVSLALDTVRCYAHALPRGRCSLSLFWDSVRCLASDLQACSKNHFSSSPSISLKAI